MSILETGYRAAATLVAPALYPFFAVHSRGRRRLAERYGNWGNISGSCRWFHGASMGEVAGLLPIARKILELYPADKPLITATSPTAVESLGGDWDARLLPLDAPWCVRRAVRGVQAKAFYFGETELWPALLRELGNTHVPLHLVNGRISDYTFHMYERLTPLFGPLLRLISSLAVVSQEAAERFIAIGAPKDRVLVTGNVKYDVAPSIGTADERAEVRNRLFPAIGDDTPIVVLGSLRPGEEKVWFPAVSAMLSEVKTTRVIVAPRHAEKFDYFGQALQISGLSYRRYSTDPPDRGEPVLLLDTMGDLEKAYSCAALAFIGATLVDVGGHNPLEAAAYGVPVAVGPYVSVIKDVVSDMRSSGGIVEVKTEADAVNLLRRVVRRDPSLCSVGSSGQTVAEKHRGATKRVLEFVTRQVSPAQ